MGVAALEDDFVDQAEFLCIFGIVEAVALDRILDCFEGLAGMITALDMNAYLVIAGIVGIYLILGCVLESLSMILLTVPVFYPLMYELNFGTDVLLDPEAALIWFAVIVVVVTEISLITPPVGLNVFVLRNALPDVPLRTIFRGVMPFWIADIVRLALLIAFPALSLWLLRWM